MSNRLQEMERRMVRRYLMGGVGLIAVSPIVFLFVTPIFAIASFVGGVLAVVRASSLSRRFPPADPR